MKKEEILKAMNWRYATKVYDTSKKVSEDDLNTVLETARLSPSSNGIEMWKFLVIKDIKIREQLKTVSYGQPKVTDASYLIVVTYRTDAKENLIKERLERTARIENVDESKLEGLKAMLENAVTTKSANGTLESWVAAQTYISLGVMIETAALLGIDACPMEGFQPDKVDEVLNLKEKNLKSVTMFTLGYRGVDPMSEFPKVRRSFDEVVEII